MKYMKRKRNLYWILIVVLVGCTGCGNESSEGSVTVYSSVDQPFAARILKETERRSGIPVRPLYDAESSKSVGLANRIMAEGEHSPAVSLARICI